MSIVRLFATQQNASIVQAREEPVGAAILAIPAEERLPRQARIG